MSDSQPLGHSDLQVPRLGVGTMTWGDPTGWSRINQRCRAVGQHAESALGCAVAVHRRRVEQCHTRRQAGRERVLFLRRSVGAATLSFRQ